MAETTEGEVQEGLQVGQVAATEAWTAVPEVLAEAGLEADSAAVGKELAQSVRVGTPEASPATAAGVEACWAVGGNAGVVSRAEEMGGERVEARTVACRAVEVVLADAAVDGQGLATAAAAVWAVGVLVMAAEAVIPVSMRLADPRSLSLESRRACATLAR